MIMEVTKGLNTAPIVEQRKKPEAPKPTPAPTRTVNQTLVERKKKLMSAIGSDAYGGIDLFEGTTPAPGQAFGAQAASPMSGTDPNDAGIDISDIVALGGKKWKAFTG